MLYYSIVKSFFLKGNKGKLLEPLIHPIPINIDIWKEKCMLVEMNHVWYLKADLFHMEN